MPGRITQAVRHCRLPTGSLQASCVENRGNDMADGTVKWFNAPRGYGFITPDDGTADVFAHISAVEGSGYRELIDGQKVSFVPEQGPKGPQAKSVRAI